MKRLVVDSQPQFVLIHDHHVYTTWSGSLEELEAEAIEVAARLGVPVEELKAHYRVMVTVTSMLTPVGESPDWEGLRAAVCEWSPPEDGTVPTWNGEPYQ